MPAGDSYTGYKRSVETRRSVRISEIIARYCIALGGAGTVVAVTAGAVVVATFRGQRHGRGDA